MASKKHIIPHVGQHVYSNVADSANTTLAIPKVTFSVLPVELRLMVWEFAVPRSRVLRLAFGTGTNDRDHPQVMGPLTFPTILHICQESRGVAIAMLQLGFGAETTELDQNWWNPSIDVLYLPQWQPPVVWDLRFFFNFQTAFPSPYVDSEGNNNSGIGQQSRHKSLASVEHLALPFDFMVLSALKFSTTNGAWLPNWLHGFKALKSLTLIIERYPRMYRPGDVLLETPGEYPINDPASTAGLHLNTPCNIESAIAKKLADFKAAYGLDWLLPVVRIMEVGVGGTKEQDGFSLPC